MVYFGLRADLYQFLYYYLMGLNLLHVIGGDNAHLDVPVGMAVMVGNSADIYATVGISVF